jgi:hypothetical protein
MIVLAQVSVDSFLLKGIPFTTERAFAFEPSKVHFGVKSGTNYNNMDEDSNLPISVVSRDGRMPWLTALLTKNKKLELCTYISDSGAFGGGLLPFDRA